MGMTPRARLRNRIRRARWRVHSITPWHLRRMNLAYSLQQESIVMALAAPSDPVRAVESGLLAADSRRIRAECGCPQYLWVEYWNRQKGWVR